MQLSIRGNRLSRAKTESGIFGDDTEEVRIPEGVEIIGRNAFLCCNAISHVQLPESLTAIHRGAFQHCYKLKEIRIPECVEEIHDEAFAYCMKIKTLTIPAKTKFIGKNVFTSCSGLSAVYVDAGNPNFCDADGVLYDKQKKTLIRFPPAKKMDVFTVPDGVEEIAEEAFQGCSLSELILPASLRIIGKDVFSHCKLLHSIHIATENLYFYAKDGVLFRRENKALFCYPPAKRDTVYKIPAGTKEIMPEAFVMPESRNDAMLQDLYIPESLERLPAAALRNVFDLTNIFADAENPHFCSVNGILFRKNMTELLFYPKLQPQSVYTVPECVKRIGDYAFTLCENISEILLPEGLEEIGEHAIYACPGLRQLVIPQSVRKLSGEIVDGCSLMHRIVLHHRRDGAGLEKKTFYGFTGEILYITDRMQLLLPSSVLENDWYDDGQYYVLFFLTCTEESGKHSFYFSKVEKPYKSLLAVWAIVHLHEPLDLYLEYLQEDDGGIRMLIEQQDYPNLAKVLEYPVITEGNIESLLQFAIDRKDTEATILLLRYKKESIGFSDTEEAFLL